MPVRCDEGRAQWLIGEIEFQVAVDPGAGVGCGNARENSATPHI